MDFTGKILALAKKHKSQLQKYLNGVSHQLSHSLISLKKHELNALFLLTLERPVDLCILLNTEFYELEKIINNPAYRNYTIPKKKGGYRVISAPGFNLKKIQKRLNYFLQAYYLDIKPKEVHGFVINPHYLGTHCNIAENARVHIGKKHLLNIDLRDFFPSISARQVKDLFCSPYFNFNDQIANALTFITTYEGKLPIGAPSSPVLSNFICFSLDNDLITFCNDHNLTYTRYADDLTFSSDTLIPSNNLLDIINLITKNNFRINEKKLRLKASNRRQVVTGLTVNEKVNVDRKILKNIRAMLHDLTMNGVDHATCHHFNIQFACTDKEKARFLDRLRGLINFVGQIRGKDDSVYLRHIKAFNGAVGKKGKKVKV